MIKWRQRSKNLKNWFQKVNLELDPLSSNLNLGLGLRKSKKRKKKSTKKTRKRKKIPADLDPGLIHQLKKRVRKKKKIKRKKKEIIIKILDPGIGIEIGVNRGSRRKGRENIQWSRDKKRNYRIKKRKNNRKNLNCLKKSRKLDNQNYRKNILIYTRLRRKQRKRRALENRI